MGFQYFATYGMEIVRVRPFNHTGPAQSPNFVVPAFASQIASIEAGLREPVVQVGNLDAERDFTDVRDIVRAYHLAVAEAEPGEVYNLSSAAPRSVRGLLESLLSMSTVDIRVEVDPSRYRPVDTPVVYGSADKFRRATGWEPEIPFEQTLKDVLGYWREQTRS
jgi:GDP-4-dehydro-6-deoxy-D-mannose reductase